MPLLNWCCCERRHPIDSPKIIAPPPMLYLGAFALGCAMHVFAPWAVPTPSALYIGLGAFLFALSTAFARWAFMAMRRAGTSASPNQPSTALSTAGPFRISRNPIYVAMTGMYLGATFFISSVWPLVLLVPLLVAMHWGVILREERYLAEKFGDTYLAYTAQVRRWL